MSKKLSGAERLERVAAKLAQRNFWVSLDSLLRWDFEKIESSVAGFSGIAQDARVLRGLRESAGADYGYPQKKNYMKGAIPTLLVCGGLWLIAFFEGWGAVGAWWTRITDAAKRRARKWED